MWLDFWLSRSSEVKSDGTSVEFNIVCHHFQNNLNQGSVTLTFNLSRSSKVKPVGTLHFLHWVQHRNSYRSPHISYIKLWLWFLTPEGHPRSNLTVLIESPWLLSKKSSLGSNLVYVTVFKIFRIKGLWPWFLTSHCHRRSYLMMPIESPWALSYMTSLESNTVSLTVWPQITCMPTNQPPNQRHSHNMCRSRSSMQYYVLQPGSVNIKNAFLWKKI